MLIGWGFPFRLFIDYKGRTVVLRTIQLVKEFEGELDKEEVEVEVLNQEVGEAEAR